MWECHRETITRLYLVEDRPLDEVRRIMAAQFGFKATKRMYTFRVKKWGIKKNYTADEKDEIALQIADALAKNQELSGLVFNNRPIKHHRIVRHVRSKEPGATPCTPQLWAQYRGRKDAAHQVPGQPTDHIGATLPFSQTRSAEIILQATHSFVSSIADITSCRPSCNAAAGDQSGSVKSGPSNPALGWENFHVAWQKAPEAAVSDPATLLRRILTIAVPAYLGHLPGLCGLILKFMAELLQIRLGAAHPLVRVCAQIQRDGETRKTLDAALGLVRDLFEERLGPEHSETFKSHLALVVCQRRNLDLAAAEKSAVGLIQRCRTCPGLHSQLTDAVLMHAYILKDQRRFGEAIALHHQILSEFHGMGLVRDGQRIGSRECLAELYRFQGHLAVESWHLAEALKDAERVYGQRAAETQHVRDKLRRSLKERGRLDEEA
ncbi:Clr5 domain-containing protein [Lasiosphaeria miniovina]|uniref:Clr5 domain-containing protein n=1 Tax=Lasiosphaeria miniovina TaxID=1954250 RepID=A0AA39ZYB2_9PEZI|nr:Clr5 domain-containing protein [Lasiosphaeria miniovina]KAK0705896.1 Clr5 domain-containing protein [Lasiosphaeria miniovina]